MAVQRLLVLVLSLFMLLVPPAVAHGLDLSQANATVRQLHTPTSPAPTDQGQDDEAIAALPAAAPELTIPTGDDDGAGGDGLDAPESPSIGHVRLAAPEICTRRACLHLAKTHRPWSTGPPRA